MPNVTIYLSEDEYLILTMLSEEQERKIKQQFKKELIKYKNIKSDE